MAERGMRMIVRGRVQGVGYRAFVLHEARRLGLGGFTRNLPDGSVEVVAGGPRLQLDLFAERLAIGPPMSRVEAVERTEIDSPPSHESFDVRY